MATLSKQRSFESIESAHEFLTLLIDTVRNESTANQFDEMVIEDAAPRYQDALRLVDYKLRKLEAHLTKSRLLLNDLRSLRRYLLSERRSDRAAHSRLQNRASGNDTSENKRHGHCAPLHTQV